MAEETPVATDDWINSTADSILNAVDKARTIGTDNAVRAVRGLVFGLVALVLSFAAFILMFVVVIRLTDAYLPIGAGVGDATWAAYLFWGLLLSILGFGLWSIRKTESTFRLKIAGLIDFLIIAAVVVYALVDWLA